MISIKKKYQLSLIFQTHNLCYQTRNIIYKKNYKTLINDFKKDKK